MNQMIVSVRDKMLRRVGGVSHFVTHNKDYEIQFQFDDSWADVRHKMAVFAYEDGEYGSEIFDGDICGVPEMPREGRIYIGLKAGDELSTELFCVQVCKSADDVITDEYDMPDPKIYEQILDIINNLWGGGDTVYPSSVKFLAAPSTAKMGDLIRVKEVDDNGYVEKTDGFDIDAALEKKIDAPENAAVGEMLIVEEIGEDERPTKWKTAFKPEITTELSADSTDEQVPSAKAVGDALAGKQAVGNYLTTESDPTVPLWAKQATKPTYTASEVGALPDTTVIPDVDGMLKYTAQSLTDAQKQQVRTNIGVASRVFYAPGETIAVPVYDSTAGTYAFNDVLLSIPNKNSSNSFFIIAKDGDDCGVYFTRSTSDDGTVQVEISTSLTSYNPVLTKCVQYFGDLFIVSFTVESNPINNSAPVKLVAHTAYGMTIAPSILPLSTSEYRGAIITNHSNYNADTQKPVCIKANTGEAYVNRDVAFTTAANLYKIIGGGYSIIIVRDEITRFTDRGWNPPYHMILLSQTKSSSRDLETEFAITSADGSKFIATCTTDSWGTSSTTTWTITLTLFSPSAISSAERFVIYSNYDSTDTNYGKEVYNALANGKTCWYSDNGVLRAITSYETHYNCGEKTLIVYYATPIKYQTADGTEEDVLAIRGLNFVM